MVKLSFFYFQTLLFQPYNLILLVPNRRLGVCTADIIHHNGYPHHDHSPDIIVKEENIKEKNIHDQKKENISSYSYLSLDNINFYEQGITYAKAANLPKAKVNFLSAVNKNPTDCKALHSLANIAMIEANFAEAVAYHELAKKSDPICLPPLALLHQNGEKCGGISDIYWVSSFSKKVLHDLWLKDAKMWESEKQIKKMDANFIDHKDIQDNIEEIFLHGGESNEIGQTKKLKEVELQVQKGAQEILNWFYDVVLGKFHLDAFGERREECEN